MECLEMFLVKIWKLKFQLNRQLLFIVSDHQSSSISNSGDRPFLLLWECTGKIGITSFFKLIFNLLNGVWFGLVWFYGISTIVGHFMPNPVYTYILNINDL